MIIGLIACTSLGWPCLSSADRWSVWMERSRTGRSRMLLDGVFVGVVGDTIVLPAERHHCRLRSRKASTELNPRHGKRSARIRISDSGDCIGQLTGS